MKEHDHERWVSLLTAEARGEELTPDELHERAGLDETADDGRVDPADEALLWRAVGHLGERPHHAEMADEELGTSVLAAARALGLSESTQTHEVVAGNRETEDTVLPFTAPPRRRYAAVAIGGALVGVAAAFILFVAPNWSGGAADGRAHERSEAAEMAARMDVVPDGTTTAAETRLPVVASADRRAPTHSVAPSDITEGDGAEGCVQLAAGGRACPASDDAAFGWSEDGDGDAPALALARGTVRVHSGREDGRSDGILAPPLRTAVGQVVAVGQARYEATLLHDPVILVLVVQEGAVKVTTLDGTIKTVEAGRTEVFETTDRPLKRAPADAQLARAQDRLVAGDAAGAARAYRRLRAEHRNSPEARAATLSLARIELGRGKAKTALRLFDAYLRRPSSASTVVEAKVGRIKALRKLGRTDDERKAIESFLSAHGGSIYAKHMKRRLAEL